MGELLKKAYERQIQEGIIDKKELRRFVLDDTTKDDGDAR